MRFVYPLTAILAVVNMVMIRIASPQIELVYHILYFFNIFDCGFLLVLILSLACFKFSKKRYRRLGAQEAVAEGNLDDLLDARYMGCVCTDAVTFALAARGGHFDIVKYLRERLMCDWNEIACEYASAGGHTETLRYLLDNGCPSNERTCEAAADYGHLDCLIVAHRHGCRWNARTTTKAFKAGHHRCFLYAVENGCPYPKVYEDAALVLQTWWRDHLYRYGSAFVNNVVKPRFEHNQRVMLL